MSDVLRYLVSIDPASKAVKVEQIGEAGDLTEVDLVPFVQSLGVGMAGASQPAHVVINVYAGGSPSGPVRLGVSGAAPETIYGILPGPPPPPPSPETIYGILPGPPPPPPGNRPAKPAKPRRK